MVEEEKEEEEEEKVVMDALLQKEVDMAEKRIEEVEKKIAETEKEIEATKQEEKQQAQQHTEEIKPEKEKKVGGCPSTYLERTNSPSPTVRHPVSHPRRYTQEELTPRNSHPHPYP